MLARGYAGRGLNLRNDGVPGAGASASKHRKRRLASLTDACSRTNRDNPKLAFLSSRTTGRDAACDRHRHLSASSSTAALPTRSSSRSGRDDCSSEDQEHENALSHPGRRNE